MKRFCLLGGWIMMATCILSCSSAQNDLIKIVSESDEVEVCNVFDPIIDPEIYEERYATSYFSYSYFRCCNDGDTLYYDWSGKRLPFDDKNTWPDSIRWRLKFHAFTQSGMEYLDGDAVRDCNLQVIIPGSSNYLLKSDDCWVFKSYDSQKYHYLYDLNGELIWQPSDGWKLWDIKKSDPNHLTLLLKRQVEGAENDEETTVEIPAPITPEQSRYCYSTSKGFRFLPSHVELQDIYSSPSIIDLGLSVKWSFCNYDESIPSIPFLDEDSVTNYTCSNDSYKKIGKGFRLPTKEEVEELLSDCIWTRMGKAGNCYLVTSKKNGTSMLMPASGKYWTSTIKNGDHIISAANEFNDVVLELMYGNDDDKDKVKVYCLNLEGDHPQIGVTNLNDSLSIRLVTGPIADE